MRPALYRVLHAARRHAAMLAVTGFLVWAASQAFDCYLASDDFQWVEAADRFAASPRLALSEAVWGTYYRPAASFAWTACYAAWGFDFRGYQMLLSLLWIGSVWMAYSIGLRLHGRLAGFLAAAMLAANPTFLRLVSWKSWLATLLELFFTLLAVRLLLDAVGRRRPWLYAAAGAAGSVAVLSKELAALVLSAVVFGLVVEPPIRSDRWTRRRALAVVAWALATLAVLMVNPSYRKAALSLVQAKAPQMAAAAGAPASPPAFAAAYIPKNIEIHLHVLFSTCFPAWVVLFALVAEFTRARRLGEKLGPQRHTVVLGAFVGLLALVPALSLAWSGLGWLLRFSLPSPHEAQAVEEQRQAAQWAALALLFIWVATRGRKNERTLGLWFAAAFAPILFLQHHSGAYLTLAFAALTLYLAVALAREARDEFLPLVSSVRGLGPRTTELLPPLLRGLLFAAALAGLAWNAQANTRDALATVRARAMDGRAMQSAVLRTVTSLAASPGRRACEFMEGPPRLAGLMLQRLHGFAVRRLLPTDGPVVVVSARPAPLPIYEDAVPLSSVAGRNLLPLAGFEQGANPRFVAPGYKSGRSLLLAPRGPNVQLERWDAQIPHASLCAFGVSFRADPGVTVSLTLETEGTAGKEVVAAWPRPVEDGWTQLVGCAWAPRGKVSVRLTATAGAVCPVDAAALADDVYLIPFAAARP